MQNSLALTLTNRSSAPCYLFGYPTVTQFDRSGRALPFDYRRAGDIVVTSRPPTRVELSPGTTAYVTIDKFTCAFDEDGVTSRIELTPPDDTLPVATALPRDAITLGYCGPGDRGTEVYVSPVEPTSQDTFAH
jgi:hypothetical protein